MSAANSTRNPPTPRPGETQYNVRDAALRGATSAFSKPPVQPKPLVNTYTGGENGALVAASKGWTTGTPQGTLSPTQKQWTGGSCRLSPSPRISLSKSSSSSQLNITSDELDRIPSPSNIAAKLAAARHTPMKPKPEARDVYVPYNRNREDPVILPPAGSVGNAKAMLNAQDNQPLRRIGSVEGSSPRIFKPKALLEDGQPTDDTSIPPTSSLVKMFEQGRATTPTKSRPNTPSLSRGPPPPIRSPKPQRKFVPPPVVDNEAIQRPENIRHKTEGAPPPKQKPAKLSLARTNTTPLKPASQRTPRPKSRGSPASTRPSTRQSGSLDGSESPSSYTSAPETQADLKTKPELPPSRRSSKPKPEPISESITTGPQKRLALPPLPSKTAIHTGVNSTLSPPQTVTPPRSVPPNNRSSPPASTYHSNYQRESVRQITKHMTGESLANAMLGAALASSRTASPAPSTSPAPPPLPSRHQQQKKHHHHVPFHHSRSPSPPKPKYEPGKLRATMRKDPSSSSSEDEVEKYKRKGTRIMGMGRKHPNKHHEGTRKRWRDTITNRERKRYEGVWAANKGLYIPPSASTTPLPQSLSRSRGHSLSQSHSPSPNRLAAQMTGDASEDVLNLVTRDIWTRSRLPEHELEEVWDLVDNRGIGRLRREEFVVGLWLIDQRLKGRKIPVRVTESVWGSVRGAGVRVKPVKL